MKKLIRLFKVKREEWLAAAMTLVMLVTLHAFVIARNIDLFTKANAGHWNVFIKNFTISGFDPINANLLKREIMRLRDNGATVIFSTHNMSSVEEICDHITLINKSHNILSGSVDEVRRRFGENIFEVTYDGDTALLESVAAPMAELLGTTEVSDTPYHTTRLKLNPTTSVRNIVAAVNDAVNLRSFNEVIPSMNDIFIRAVEGKL